MAYAIVSIGGKQYRVQEGEKLLVDRLAVEENKTFHPNVLFLGGDGDAQYAPKGAQVTARVVQHLRGDKITIGKHKQRTGYRRHTGFRASLTQIEIQTIGKTAAAKPKAAEEKAPAKAKPKAEAEPKPKAAAAKKTAAKPKTTTKKTTEKK